MAVAASSATRLNTISPLRYPGGKSNFSPLISRILEKNRLSNCDYFEPYAGGAGVGLNLLSRQLVRRVHLNDADHSIFAFWRNALFETDRFCQTIQDIEVTYSEWLRQRDIYRNPKQSSLFDLGFATFFLNRCNRSGIIKGGGPIGGARQTGQYRINARFPKEKLIERIRWIASRRESITISNLDALWFIKSKVNKLRNNVFVYLDPPYLEQGRRLYFDAYTLVDHEKIAHYLSNLKRLRWLVSYDHHPALRPFYKGARMSAASKLCPKSLRVRTTEVLFFPSYLRVSPVPS